MFKIGQRVRVKRVPPNTMGFCGSETLYDTVGQVGKVEYRSIDHVSLFIIDSNGHRHYYSYQVDQVQELKTRPPPKIKGIVVYRGEIREEEG